MPTALKLARGTPGHHAVNYDEPDLAPPSPAVPAGLTGRAEAEWVRLVDELIAKGVLTTADLVTFEAYCTLVGEVSMLEQHLAKTRTWTDRRLRLSRFLLQLRTQLRQTAAHLGLTPSSRSSVKAIKSTANARAAKQRRFFGRATPPRGAS